MNMVKLTKGKGIVLSSETSSRLFMRSPLDVVSIGQMIGLGQQDARNSVSQNCLQAIQHAHYRKTHKGVAEITI
jgi:RNase P/RNase MRP subunit p30